MITIDLLKNHPQHIPQLSAIWQEVLGKKWTPNISIETTIERFEKYIENDSSTITFIVLDKETPIATCSLFEHNKLRPNLGPWLGSLAVDPKYQNKAIGKMLIETVRKKAKELGFRKLYLFAYTTLIDYYARLGWREIGTDEYEGHPITAMEVDSL